MLKPIATEISSWQPYKEIIYSCPVCRTSFRYFGPKEKFCHNCGVKIDWDVLLALKEPFEGDYEKQKLFIAELNRKQKGEMT